MTEAVEQHREDLEDLAKSDLPCNWIAETVLEVAQEDATR